MKSTSSSSLHSCMPSSEADLLLSIPYSSCHINFLISCHAAQTTHTAVCHLQRQTPFLSICHSSCHINFLSLVVQHKLHSCMTSSEADLDVILTGHPLHPPRCSCLHRMWWEVAALSSANLGHTVSKQRPAAQYTNTGWSVTSQTPGSRHITHTPGGQSHHKHQVVGHITHTPGGQSHHKHQVVGHITHTPGGQSHHKHQVVGHITHTPGGQSHHKHQVVGTSHTHLVVSHITNTR